MKHAVIWQGNQQEARAFAQGLCNNHWSPAIVCREDNKDTFVNHNMQCFDWPENDQDWSDVLHSMFVALTAQIHAHEQMDQLVLDIIYGTQNYEHAYELAKNIQQAADQVIGWKHSIHLILQINTVADSESGKLFLKELQRDAEQNSINRRELEKKKREIEDNLDKEYRKALAVVDPYDQETPTLLTAQKGKKAREEFKKLEESILQSERMKWERLSVLSDHSDGGSMDPQIAKDREDILCGVVMNPGQIESGKLYECYAYYIRKTSFSRDDVERLPAFMLFDKIKSHEEKLALVQETLVPDHTDYTETLEQHLTAAFPELDDMLLLDDNNYEERSGRKLMEDFLALNQEMFLKVMDIDAVVDQWIRKIKKELACWVDVDQEICEYIQPGGGLETELRRLESEAGERYFANSSSDLRFGYRISLRKRKINARILAEKVIRATIQSTEKQLYEQMLSRLPELNEYLVEIKNTINTLFHGYSRELVEAFAGSPWIADIREALNRFQLDQLHECVGEQTYEAYATWLKDRLDDMYFDQIVQTEKQKAEDDFIQKASQYPEKDEHAYKMIDHGFGAITKGGDDIVFLGSTTRLFKLTGYTWNIETVPFDQVFHLGAMQQPIQKNVTNDIKEFVQAEESNNLMMGIHLDQDGNSYLLKWRWPRNAEYMDLSIDTKYGSKQLYGTSVRKMDPKGEIRINPSELPFDEEVVITLKDQYGPIFCTETVKVPRIEKNIGQAEEPEDFFWKIRKIFAFVGGRSELEEREYRMEKPGKLNEWAVVIWHGERYMMYRLSGAKVDKNQGLHFRVLYPKDKLCKASIMMIGEKK